VPRFIGLRLGRLPAAQAQPVELEGSIEALPSVLWDGVVLPSGPAMESALAASAEILDFVKEQYRHCKPMLLLGPDPAGTLSALGIAAALDGEAPDPGLVLGGSLRTDAAANASSEEPADASVDQAVAEFLQSLARHRHFERELEVPRV